MRVLLAGATGAIGKPLVHQLLQAHHDVIGVTRTEHGAKWLRARGATAFVVDVLDRDALLRALEGVRADAVVHQLTSITKMPMRARDLAPTNTLRTVGTTHLIEAAHAVQARRFVAQSYFGGYGYRDHGPRRLTEDDAFAESTRGPMRDVDTALRFAEAQALGTPGLAGIVLRYGAYYGIEPMRPLIADLRRRRLPVVSGGGLLPFIEVTDAAAATVTALESGQAGHIYNIVDDEPASLSDVLRSLAAGVGAPPPRELPSWLLRVLPLVHAISTATVRVSNDKAKRMLGWRPRFPTWREGVAHIVDALAHAAEGGEPVRA